MKLSLGLVPILLPKILSVPVPTSTRASGPASDPAPNPTNQRQAPAPAPVPAPSQVNSPTPQPSDHFSPGDSPSQVAAPTPQPSDASSDSPGPGPGPGPAPGPAPAPAPAPGPAGHWDDSSVDASFDFMHCLEYKTAAESESTPQCSFAESGAAVSTIFSFSTCTDWDTLSLISAIAQSEDAFEQLILDCGQGASADCLQEVSYLLAGVQLISFQEKEW